MSGRASLGASTDESLPSSASAAYAAGKGSVIGKRMPNATAGQPLVSALGPMTACWLKSVENLLWLGEYCPAEYYC